MSPMIHRGLTLIEVVAALVLTATTVTALLMAQTRSLTQLHIIRQQKIAADLAHELIRQWQLQPDELSRSADGSFDVRPGWTWERRATPSPLAGALNEVTLTIYGPTDDVLRTLLVTYTWLEKPDAAD